MAHKFDIPVSFHFLSQRISWAAYPFSIAGRRKDLPHQRPTFLGTDIPLPLLGADIEPFDYWLISLGQTQGEASASVKTNMFYATHETELSKCLEIVAELQFAGEPIPSSLSEIFVTPRKKETVEKEMDPWKMREAFLRLEESNEALLSFLQRWGLWDFSTLNVVDPSRGADIPFPIGGGLFCVLPHLVWEQRKCLRKAMLGSAETWLTKDASLGATHRRSRFPYLGITDKLCTKALETTITLDHLRAVKSRLCARSDCNNIFAVESAHGKIYCEQYCGHLVSLRRKRASAKHTKQSAKMGGRKNVDI